MTTSQRYGFFIIIALLVIGGLALYGTPMKTESPADDAGTGTKISPTGTVIIGLTDAAMSLENVTEVMAIVGEVRIHSAAKGWITLSEEKKQLDLLKLKANGIVTLLAEANVEPGTYDQIRLTIEGVRVTHNGKTAAAKLPSGDLKIMAAMTVRADETSAAVVDILADQSLHVTGSGKIIFAPVIKVQSHSNADVKIGTDQSIEVRGGYKETDEEVGMDENGALRANFRFDGKAKLEILDDVIRIITKTGEDASVKITAKAAVDAAVSGGYIGIPLSVKLVEKNGASAWLISGIKGTSVINVYFNATTGAFVEME